MIARTLEEAAGAQFHECVSLLGAMRELEGAARDLAGIDRYGDSGLRESRRRKVRLYLDRIEARAENIRQFARRWNENLSE